MSPAPLVVPVQADTTTTTPTMFALSDVNNTPLGTRAAPAPATTTTTPTTARATTARPAKKGEKDHMKGWRPRPTTFGYNSDGKFEITFSSRSMEERVGARLRAQAASGPAIVSGRVQKHNPPGEGKSKCAIQRRRRKEKAEKEAAEKEKEKEKEKKKKAEEKKDQMEVDGGHRAGDFSGGAGSDGADGAGV